MLINLQAQRALKKGKINRFLKNNDEVLDGDYSFDRPERIDVVPRIAVKRKPIEINCIEPEKGFDNLSGYTLKKNPPPQIVKMPLLAHKKYSKASTKAQGYQIYYSQAIE